VSGDPDAEDGAAPDADPDAGDGAAPDADPARAALDAARRSRRPASRRSAGSRRSGGYTGPGPDPRDPALLSELVDRLVADRGWQRIAADASVLGRWDALVGADIAAHCQPASLRAGELVVVAESTAWATQLRLLAGRIQATLTRELGPGVVSSIRIHGPTAPSWRKGPRRVVGRGPRDTYG